MRYLIGGRNEQQEKRKLNQTAEEKPAELYA
jgi:hypothetical protein